LVAENEPCKSLPLGLPLPSQHLESDVLREEQSAQRSRPLQEFIIRQLGRAIIRRRQYVNAAATAVAR
jgi:hypothetical protein